MKDKLYKLIRSIRNWLIIKLANGEVVILNARLTKGLYFERYHGFKNIFIYNLRATGDGDGAGIEIGSAHIKSKTNRGKKNMSNSSIDFIKKTGLIEVWYEQDVSPFDEKLMGCIRKSEDGYYRFHPARRVFFTCKQLKILSEKISELNLR